MSDHNEPPVWAWRASIGMLAASVLIAVGLLAATLSGVADPRPVAALVVDDDFQSATGWQMAPDGVSASARGAEREYRLTVRAGQDQIWATSPHEITPPYTLELSARQISGQGDVGYGLWWGTADHTAAILMAVNSDGYMAVATVEPQSQAPALNWLLFPHVRPEGQINIFRADQVSGQLTVRLNDEIAGQFSADWPGRVQAGFFIRESQHGSAVIEFLSFKVWEDRASAP
jgi:hypothetical protein